MFLNLKTIFVKDFTSAVSDDPRAHVSPQMWFEDNMPLEYRDYDAVEVIYDLCCMYKRDPSSTKFLIPSFEETLEELSKAYWEERTYVDSLPKQHAWVD